MRIEKRVSTLEELHEAVAEWKRTILGWGYPTNVGSGFAPDKGEGTLMAHGYEGFDTMRTPHSYIIRTTNIDADTVFAARDGFDDELLDAGLPVSVGEGTYITHLFNKGRHPKAPTMGYISFGVRLSDEDAIAMLLRDCTGMSLMHVDGPYTRDHP